MNIVTLLVPFAVWLTQFVQMMTGHVDAATMSAQKTWSSLDSASVDVALVNGGSQHDELRLRIPETIDMSQLSTTMTYEHDVKRSIVDSQNTRQLMLAKLNVDRSSPSNDFRSLRDDDNFAADEPKVGSRLKSMELLELRTTVVVTKFVRPPQDAVIPDVDRLDFFSRSSSSSSSADSNDPLLPDADGQLSNVDAEISDSNVLAANNFVIRQTHLSSLSFDIAAGGDDDGGDLTVFQPRNYGVSSSSDVAAVNVTPSYNVSNGEGLLKSDNELGIIVAKHLEVSIGSGGVWSPVSLAVTCFFVGLVLPSTAVVCCLWTYGRHRRRQRTLAAIRHLDEQLTVKTVTLPGQEIEKSVVLTI